jgi:hypothetical protein
MSDSLLMKLERDRSNWDAFHALRRRKELEPGDQRFLKVIRRRFVFKMFLLNLSFVGGILMVIHPGRVAGLVGILPFMVFGAANLSFFWVCSKPYYADLTKIFKKYEHKLIDQNKI